MPLSGPTFFPGRKAEHLAIKEATLSTVLQTYYTEQEVIGLQKQTISRHPGTTPGSISLDHARIQQH